MSGLTWPEGYGRVSLGAVRSTMDVAAAAAPDLHQPTWFFAQAQTGARGRRGRAWRMPQGNFAATLVLKPDGAVGQVALRSFAAALALDGALRAIGVPGADLALKWPNDVLYRGGKLAGILLESEAAHLKDASSDPVGVAWLSVGFGVNLAQAPAAEPDAAFAPTALAPEHRIKPEEFLIHLAQAYAAWEARFCAEGFAPLRAAWLARAARLGQEVTAQIGATQVTGRFETVDEQGNLVLETDTGQRRIAAAEIYF